jgi:glycerol kinase
VVRALAIDVGSSSVRTALVDEAGNVTHVRQRRLPRRSLRPGEVEYDALEIVSIARQLANATLREGGGCAAVGITNQRATTVLFDRESLPVGPALSWEDLRTVMDCLVLQGRGIFLAPNQSATKVKWLLENSGRPGIELRFATLETWLAWNLSAGQVYASDHSNASVSGLIELTGTAWSEEVRQALGIEDVSLPCLVDTMGTLGSLKELDGAPPLTALVGDQSASLFGQSCVHAGAKITFGTGAILDMIHGRPPATLRRLDSGCYPTVVRSQEGEVVWGVEAIDFSAGSSVQWLADLGVISEVTLSEELAASVPSSEGVTFVPALLGLGTPRWDFGARGAFFGLTRGSGSAHLARAVLEGVAQRGADLVEAAEREAGSALAQIRVDGGMSTNNFFVQRLADFSGRSIAVSSEREATTRGAGLMALVGAGHLRADDVASIASSHHAASPEIDDAERAEARSIWFDAVERAARSIPELSAVSF